MTSATRGRSIALLALSLVLLVLLFPAGNTFAQAGCPLTLNVPMQSSNGQSGVTLDITAIKSTSICRFWIQPSTTGSHTVQIWKHPNGVVNANDGLWQYIGTATFNMPTTGINYEIPVDVNVLLDPGQKMGFAIFSSSTIRYSTVSAPLFYADSYINVNVNQYGITGSTTPPSTTAWSFGFFPRGLVGQVQYKEGCFFPPGIASSSLADAAGNPIAYAEIPSNVFIKYGLDYPAGASNFTLTVTFKKVGVASPAPPSTMFTTTINVIKQAGQTLSGLAQVSLPATLQPGFYTIEYTGNSQNSCGNYQDYTLPSQGLMLVNPGTAPCVVWPGDADNDTRVTYADRAYINSYIFNAGQRTTWLQGPARYMANASPMAYLNWTPQASVPWQTPDGCYVDCDGNGVINNFDLIAVKLNWMKNHPPKAGANIAVMTFDMTQNYPNPFNPSTRISCSVPEPSIVKLVVTDMLGRTVATLVDGRVEAGTFESQFDASSLNSGNYIATVVMQGIESGLSFSKTIKMTLMK